MRLGSLVLLALIALVAPSLTYAQGFEPPPTLVTGRIAFGAPARPMARPDDVIARLMSFDRNNDGKVQKTELAERMYGVMARGDADGDGALDRSELLTLANARPTEMVVRGFGHGRYMIGSETDLSSRRHFEGAIEDLRIGFARREPALAIVRTFIGTREASLEGELLDVLRSILSEEQMRTVTTSLERERRLGLPRMLSVSRPDTQAGVAQSQVSIVALGSDLERRVVSFNLSPEMNSRAVAALKEYRTRLRPNDADRAELGRQLASVLTREECDDFLAAIARQPVVAADGTAPVFTKVGSQVGGTVRFVTGTQ